MVTSGDSSEPVQPESVPSWGLQGSWPLNSSLSLDSFPPRPLSVGFRVLTVVSLQTLPFVARLNSPMGPGRTIVIKGEVNTNAKGSVSRGDLLSADAGRVSYCCAPAQGGEYGEGWCQASSFEK